MATTDKEKKESGLDERMNPFLKQRIEQEAVYV
jgi:hypothetical protein